MGIDVDAAGALVAELRASSRSADSARSLVADAAFLADISVPCVLALDGIDGDFAQLANRIEWAMTVVRQFELRFRELTDWSAIPQPVRTPVPEATPTSPVLSTAMGGQPAAAQWNAYPDAPLDDVLQVASHNSYAVSGGIGALYEHGVRAFEIDIHRNPPPFISITGPDGSNTPEWSVHHVIGWSHREYESLAQGLAAVASLGSSDPVTVFIDNKDDFGGSHTADAFDQVLKEELGEVLFTPADLLGGSPGSTSLLEAVQRDGWPTIEQLDGRVILVLTDRVQGYYGNDRLAFVAQPPSFAVAAGEIVHAPSADVVFYNANARAISPNEVQAVHTSGTLLRTYFNPLCVEQVIGQESAKVHYRAVDVAVDGTICEERVIAPPTPVPGPD